MRFCVHREDRLWDFAFIRKTVYRVSLRPFIRFCVYHVSYHIVRVSYPIVRLSYPIVRVSYPIVYHVKVNVAGTVHLHFFKIFLFTLSTQYPLLSSPIWMTPRHCDVNIMQLIELMKIRSSVNSLIAGNRLMNCWQVNRTVCF